MQLLARLWIYVYLSHIQHYYLQQHVLFKLMSNESIIVHKMPVCSHSSVDTHTDSTTLLVTPLIDLE